MSRGKVFLKGPLTPWSGYGRDVIGLASALNRANYDVTIFPTAVNTPLPIDVAYLLTKAVEPPYDIVIHHIDPDACGLTDAEKQLAPVRILWTMWEYLSFGPERTEEVRSSLSDYNLVLGYDDVTCHALSLAQPEDSSVEVATLQGGYDPEIWQVDPAERDWDGTFRYSMVGMLGLRKNPWVAIDAFNELKAERKDFDAELHLKTMSPGLHPKMEESFPGLRIHYIAWPPEVLREFYLRTHCYLGPSWGEGKNLPAIECSTTGAPAAVTNFGGHVQWAREEWSYLLDFEWGEHETGMISARVKKDHLKEVMARVYENRSEAREKGLLAAKTLPVMMSWDAVVERFAAKVTDFRKGL